MNPENGSAGQPSSLRENRRHIGGLVWGEGGCTLFTGTSACVTRNTQYVWCFACASGFRLGTSFELGSSL